MEEHARTTLGSVVGADDIWKCRMYSNPIDFIDGLGLCCELAAMMISHPLTVADIMFKHMHDAEALDCLQKSAPSLLSGMIWKCLAT